MTLDIGGLKSQVEANEVSDVKMYTIKEHNSVAQGSRIDKIKDLVIEHA